MRLTQIKLSGFKSFADAVTIPIPSQLVGVVGPNGCGKSNIIDAVRWVLGEARAAELRGATMQDVIFNGSQERRASARAAVELVFDNSAGRAGGQWSSYAEIAVRRVLNRAGASGYYINKQQVRRRDIHDIFLGTGLGARGYAIIGQGMINRLIEAKPEELRVYLEEAAGVSRYKERRRETQSRLADARANLARLEDLQQELDGQLQKLQRQAELARQYQELAARLATTQNQLAWLREQAASAQCAQLAADTEAAQADLQAATAGLQDQQIELENLRNRHFMASEAMHQAQALLYQQGADVSRLESDIRHTQGERARCEQRLADLRLRQEQYGAARRERQQALAGVHQELEFAQERAEQLGLSAQDAQEKLPHLEDECSGLERARDEQRAQLARHNQDLALCAQTEGDSARQWQNLQNKTARLQAEANEPQGVAASELHELQARAQALAARAQQSELRLVEHEARQPELEAARRSAQERSQQAQQRLQTLQARARALQELQHSIQAQDALLPWLERHGFAQAPRLWQRLSCSPELALALEVALAERLHALELSDLDALAALAPDPPPAKLAFFQNRAGAGKPGAAPRPAQARALLDYVRCPDSALAAQLARWLDGVYIATSLEAALAARAQLAPGCAWVVADGHWVEADGVRFYAAADSSAGMLARQQQIEHLALETRAAKIEHEKEQAAFEQAQAACHELSRELAALRQQAAELARASHDAALRHVQLSEQAQQGAQRRARAAQDLQENLALQTELLERRDQAQERYAELDEIMARAQEQFEQIEDSYQDARALLIRAREQAQTRQQAAREADFEALTLENRAAELARAIEQAAAEEDRSQREAAELRAELAGLDDSAARAALQDAVARRAQHEEEQRAARRALEDAQEALRGADERRLARELQIEPLRARIGELALAEQAARLAREREQQFLAERQADRHLIAQQIAALPAERRAPQYLADELARLARRQESLGAVNLAALAELEQAQSRQEFMQSQLADLLAAINTLEGAIRTIDKETRALLAETFELVNNYFGELFPQLFGGGRAQLILAGEEILDSGVQVMAQPPGKKNSSIALLSGGEKALTATALVFALFKLNPAPFCLLDEVDAPLDDANTERYAKMVQGMSAQTQFLFISHNKIAMQMAHQLIGVTMQEQGVSRIVAVDMEAALQWLGAAQ